MFTSSIMVETMSIAEGSIKSPAIVAIVLSSSVGDYRRGAEHVQVQMLL